ncbi:MAG: hypothetical protein J6M18_05160 [Actinomycetaceae bacterium]|nr:hypothetical protein [Actinomycetaceae bacterium]
MARMRIYIPLTYRDLFGDVIARKVAFSVTKSIQETYLPQGVPEKEHMEYWEHIAMTHASAQSAYMVKELYRENACEEDVCVRIVAAADIDAAHIKEDENILGCINLVDDVKWSQVVSLHLDGSDISDYITAFLHASDEGTSDKALEKLLEYPLLWFDISELDDLRQAFS